MDKKKTIIRLITLCLLLTVIIPICGQEVKQIKFCDRKYEYGIGKDSLTLYFNVLDAKGERIQNISDNLLQNYLVVKENGTLIPSASCKISSVTTGQRIPEEYTFSVLVDLSIPQNGKYQIYQAISQLVNISPQGSVYLSFFGDKVTASKLVTTKNLKSFEPFFSKSSDYKYLYGALYSKLAEFNTVSAEKESSIVGEAGYTRNSAISERAMRNKDKNILFVFTEGNKSPSFEENIAFIEVNEYQQDKSHLVPTVYAFYYTEQGKDVDIENVLMAICNPKVEGRIGDYKPANDMAQVLHDFQQIVNDKMYDFSFTYCVPASKTYFGKTSYTAEWKGDVVGNGNFSIGSVERPWPEHETSTSDSAYKYIVAAIVAVLTIIFFFLVMKIFIPIFRSKVFCTKYYKKYVPEKNISSRICHYCKQPIGEGQSVVTKCKHIMHVHCWKQNGYKCAEYGQNCKEGIQEHVEWKELLKWRSLKECHQAIAGICAGFISWIFFETGGRGYLDSLSKSIVKMFYTSNDNLPNLALECEGKTSAFLSIGILLGFFLSLIFRYNDEYRKKDWKICLKIIGLSLFTGLVGMLAFAVGATILCTLLTVIKTSYIPWYCSFPAYLLFSVFVSLALTIKSSIPLKSALIGGVLSSFIGFFVLYFSSLTNVSWPWMNMLLDFIIYGGGLGASLVTVRMLAEKYFLVITNGVRAGQRIPIHKWMSATGGGNKVTIGMTGDCEIQMNWEKSNKVAKEHAQLFVDHERLLPMIKPLATGVVYNTRAELAVGKSNVLSNNDTFQIGDTIFQYVETE